MTGRLENILESRGANDEVRARAHRLLRHGGGGIPHEKLKGTLFGHKVPFVKRSDGYLRIGVFGLGGTVVILEYSKIVAATAFSCEAIPPFFSIPSIV